MKIERKYSIFIFFILLQSVTAFRFQINQNCDMCGYRCCDLSDQKKSIEMYDHQQSMRNENIAKYILPTSRLLLQLEKTHESIHNDKKQKDKSKPFINNDPTQTNLQNHDHEVIEVLTYLNNTFSPIFLQSELISAKKLSAPQKPDQYTLTLVISVPISTNPKNLQNKIPTHLNYQLAINKQNKKLTLINGRYLNQLPSQFIKNQQEIQKIPHIQQIDQIIRQKINTQLQTNIEQFIIKQVYTSIPFYVVHYSYSRVIIVVSFIYDQLLGKVRVVDLNVEDSDHNEEDDADNNNIGNNDYSGLEYVNQNTDASILNQNQYVTNSQKNNNKNNNCLIFNGQQCQQCTYLYRLVDGICLQIENKCIIFDEISKYCLQCCSGYYVSNQGECLQVNKQPNQRRGSDIIY